MPWSVDPGPRRKSVSGFPENNSEKCSVSSARTDSSVSSSTISFPAETRCGSTSVLAVANKRTRHSPFRYASSSRSRISAVPMRSSERRYAARRRAAAEGDTANSPECILTPAGIPRMGTRSCTTAATSRAVPSPPQNKIRSAPRAIVFSTACTVSPAVVVGRGL